METIYSIANTYALVVGISAFSHPGERGGQHTTVRGGQADDLAAKRGGGLSALPASGRVKVRGAQPSQSDRNEPADRSTRVQSPCRSPTLSISEEW